MIAESTSQARPAIGSAKNKNKLKGRGVLKIDDEFLNKKNYQRFWTIKWN